MTAYLAAPVRDRRKPPLKPGRLAAGILTIWLSCAAAPAQPQPKTMNMIVAPDGVYLDGQAPATAAALTTRLKILAARRPPPTIYVSGQPGVSPAAVNGAAHLCVSVGLVCTTGRMPTRTIMGGGAQ